MRAKAIPRRVAKVGEENLMGKQPPQDLEVDTELLEQLTDGQLHLLAAFRRLRPTQRTALVRLISQGKPRVTGREEDQLIAAFHQLTPTQQAALLELVDKIVEDGTPLQPGPARNTDAARKE